MGCVDRAFRHTFELRTGGPDSALGIMERAGRVRVGEPGQVHFVQGDACQGVYVVCSGLVGLRRSDEDGNSALLSLAGPGHVLGYRAFLADDLHSNTAEALTLCRVLFIANSHIRRLIDQSAIVREYITQLALADLNRSQAKCAALLTEGLRTRFIKLLLMLHEYCGPKHGAGRYELDLPIQRKDIAALIGAAPGSLSRLISDLEAEGLIRVEGRRVEFTAAVRTIGRGAVAPQSTPPVPNGPLSNIHILATLMEARRALLSMIDAEDAAIRDALNHRVQTTSARLDALLSELSGSDARAVARLRRIWEAFKSTRQNEIIPAVYAGKSEQAKMIATGIQHERLAVMTAIIAPHAH